MDSIVSALRSIPKAMAVAVKVLNARAVAAIINRHGLLEIYEAAYREQLLKADPQIFNEGYFHDVALILKEMQEKIHRATWWTSLTAGLLLLLIFRIVDTINFYGTIIDLHKFSPIILLIYSGSRLRIVLLGIVMGIRASLLKAHARVLTNDENANLYHMRYSARFSAGSSPFVKSLASPTFTVRKTLLAKRLIPFVKFLPLIFITFVCLYIISYLVVIFIVIITPGISLIARTILSLLSVALESLAILIPAFGSFIAMKDPNSGKAFWNKIRSAVNQNIARGTNAAESQSTREV
jgi:hypothetical protein